MNACAPESVTQEDNGHVCMICGMKDKGKDCRCSEVKRAYTFAMLLNEEVCFRKMTLSDVASDCVFTQTIPLSPSYLSLSEADTLQTSLQFLSWWQFVWLSFFAQFSEKIAVVLCPLLCGPCQSLLD